jgi:multidrug efflux system outer membrane protein
MLTLTTELASNYFQLRSLDSQIDVLQSTISVREKLLKLAQSRFDNGLINHIDVFNATLQLSNVQAEYANNMRLRNLQENALAVLIGLPPPLFSLQHHPLTTKPPVIPASLPSEVLHQRPDIAQAERNMEAQHALIGVAYASFFPSLNLTGTLGFSSPDLKDFMTWQSRFWSYGFNSAQTIFDAGRNCSNLSASWARFSQARNAYQKQILIAFREVEDALKNLEMQNEQSASLEVALSSSQKTIQLSQSRYFKGLTNSFEFIEAEKSVLEAQLNVINLLGVRYLSTIQLIKALGGSWSSESYLFQSTTKQPCGS